MKTQIITLESHDDLISVRDKLSWAKTPRILLVWPKYEMVALRVLDLKVLQRHADSLGAQLGLVTRRTKVRRDAESLGIPVFESTTSAQRDPWPDPAPRSRRAPNPPRRDLRKMRDEIQGRESAWSKSLFGRAVTFTVGVMAFVTVAGLFVPRAALTLYPEEKIQSIAIPVTASESNSSVSLTGAIPAQTLKSVVEAEQSLAIVSEISVPTAKAKGIARFTNLSQNEVSIPAGTVVATAAEPPVKFVTVKDATLEAGIDEFVDVPIEAVESGGGGNTDRNTVVVVEGPLGLSISVTNLDPVRGGVDSLMIGPTDDDRSRLSGVVMDNLRRMAEADLRAQIASSDVLLSDTMEILEITKEEFDPPVGRPGKTLTLKMQVEFSARFVSGEDLKELALSTLNASIENGFAPTNSPEYKIVTQPSTDTSGVSHFDLVVTRALLREVDKLYVFSLVHGRKPDLVKEELTSALPLRQPTELSLTPSWWPWMPLIPFNVSVAVK